MLTTPPDIFTIFSALTDPRQLKKVDHQLSDRLLIALCGAICGVDTWAELERQDFGRVDLLHQFAAAEGAGDRETSPHSLDGGESVTLVVGCHFCRGCEPHSERERSGNRGSVSSRGVVAVKEKHDGESESKGETSDGGGESGGPGEDSLGAIRLNSCDCPVGRANQVFRMRGQSSAGGNGVLEISSSPQSGIGDERAGQLSSSIPANRRGL